MIDVIALLEKAADRLEIAGRYREAEEIDVLANSVEAAARRPLHRKYVEGIPLTQRKFSDPKNIKEKGDKPTKFDIAKSMVDDHIDERNLAIGAVKAGMERYGRILDRIAKDHPEVASKARQYRQKVNEMSTSIEKQLKDFLLYLMHVKGGPEVTESMMDYESS